jgi:hypothetical protein
MPPPMVFFMFGFDNKVDLRSFLEVRLLDKMGCLRVRGSFLVLFWIETCVGREGFTYETKCEDFCGYKRLLTLWPNCLAID